MKEKTELEVIIDENCEVKVHVKGEKGPKCLNWLKAFEEFLGPVKWRELTNEYYQVEEKTQIQTKVKKE